MEPSEKPIADTIAGPVPTPGPQQSLHTSDLPVASEAPAAVPVSLKDRVALRVKAIQKAAPGAASDLKAKVIAGATAAGLDKINRESLKAGRDGLAAKVEAILKPRAADDVPSHGAPGSGAPGPGAPSDAPPPAGSLKAAALTPAPDRADISALKAKLDAALRPKDETGVTIKPDAASAGIAARIAAALPKRAWSTGDWKTGDRKTGGWKKSDWTVPFTRSTRQAADPAMPSAPADIADVDPSPEISQNRTTRTERLRTERIVARTRPRRSLLTVGMLATALVTGAVLHILTTFSIPMLSSSWFRWSAFDRIKSQLDVNTMKVWPLDPTGTMPLPFLSPDMRYAFCRFDITSGPVTVSVILPEVGWSLALYTPSGDNFYAVPGQDGRTVEAVFNIMPASDRLLIPVPGQRRADIDAAQVTSAAREGLVVVRGPHKGAATGPAVETALRRARCSAVERR